MLFTDTYLTIDREATATYKDRGSKFIGFAFPATSESQCMIRIQELKKEHPHAAHHCFAFVLGKQGEIHRFNDDREPANTAGRPILRTIISKKLTQVCVVVVRYFGGKLLGVPGLIQAYESAAAAALNEVSVVERTVQEEYEITAPYDHEHDLFRLVKAMGLQVKSHHHGDTIQLVVAIRKSKADQFQDAVRLNPNITLRFITES